MRRAPPLELRQPALDTRALSHAVIAGGLIAAEVRWSKGTQFGCQFKEKFNLKLLQPAKTDAKGPAVMAPDYLKAGDAGGK